MADSRRIVTTMPENSETPLERAGGWSGTNLVLPEGTWTDILNNTTYHGGPVPLPTLLATYPISLLTRD